MFTRDLIAEEIERLSTSTALHNSESLCKLLRYLSEQSIDNHGAAIKEYQIATEVFQRSADFDPQLDSVVRVQAGRLRNKLAAYYSSEGENNRIIVDLPKGNYALTFRENPRKKPWPADAIEPRDASASAIPAPLPPRKSPVAIAVLSSLLAISVVAIALLLAARKPANGPSAVSVGQAPAAVQHFWGAFLSTPDQPWVVFSNATFVGRPETGMSYYNAANPGKGRIFDHYTGVGEVLAVHNLDEIFASLHGRVRVKRGSLFSLDDVKQNNLIFLGSPAEILNLRDIPNATHFVFQRLASGPRAGDLSIVTVAPHSGEPAVSIASPADQPLTEDYAVVSFKHGIESSHLVLSIAGTTTFGTQGAVEYLCSPESLEELLSRLDVHRAEDLQPFEALLRIRISRGVPVETTLIAVRKGS